MEAEKTFTAETQRAPRKSKQITAKHARLKNNNTKNHIATAFAGMTMGFT
jgi:hypothetical protein